jgi:glycosyltransferase involved in cell wall biosynthesis
MRKDPPLVRELDPKPLAGPRRVVGVHQRAPDVTGRRMAEGGLRLQGVEKASRPGEPLVSIVTICLNSAATLEQAIESVRAQTWPNIDYVVVDGCSTDGTLDIIRRHADTIDYFVSEPDGGLYQAMNKAISLAQGDHVLVLNSDDWYAPDAVETLVRAREYSGRDFVSALARYVDGEGQEVEVLRSMPFDAGIRLRMPLRHETMLLSAALYEEFGPYDDSYRVIADFELTMRLFDGGVTHYEVPRPLLNFRTTGVSSVDTTRLFAERRRLLGTRFPGLSAVELDTLQEMARLRPEDVEPLAMAHLGDAELLDALKAHQTAQARRHDAPAWRRHPVDWAAIAARSPRPLVTVILPIYNAQDTLAAAIDSVLAQTLGRWELLCILDASPDGSLAIAQGYAARDPRVRVLVNEHNIGLGATRNRGVREARGAWVFHLDPDDTLPPRALQSLHEVAARHRNEMVKGAYVSAQMLHGRQAGQPVRKSLVSGGGPVLDTSLARFPALLRTTEGHWSYLYDAVFARRVPYPVDLKMGQDSIFLAHALAQARSVSVVDDVVYHYSVNASSAMNTFSLRKCRDGLEWRRRAWHVLRDHGHRPVGNALLSAYWSADFFATLVALATPQQLEDFLDALRTAWREAGLSAPTAPCPALLPALMNAVLEGRDADVPALVQRPDLRVRWEPPTAPGAGSPQDTAPAAGSGLKVATFCAMDHGGAGTGSQRRVEALRKRGLDAKIHALIARSGRPWVHPVRPSVEALHDADPSAIWQAVRERTMNPARELPGYRASEVFSLPESVVDFRDLRPVFDDADVLHFHWVVGMFDYEHAGDELADRPVIWTLADMNAFTGGCHYSEGCEEFKRECRQCPQLGGDSDMAHQAWKRKKAAYGKMHRLHIVCPSKWMAERVAASSLLGDKKVHVIPNAFPVDRFAPANKIVARTQLGLPLDRKLLLFGADSLDNKRKGGEQLREAMELISTQPWAAKVEVVLFGHRGIELPLPVHPMGHVSDDARLALIYSAADAFVFPSHEDNAPLTVGEAMLCGTPVVAFPVGNVPDLVQHEQTGYLARYLDVPDLCNGIRWALAVDGRAALERSLRCRVRAASFHDPGEAAERHVQVYLEAMSHA